MELDISFLFWKKKGTGERKKKKIHYMHQSNYYVFDLEN